MRLFSLDLRTCAIPRFVFAEVSGVEFLVGLLMRGLIVRDTLRFLLAICLGENAMDSLVRRSEDGSDGALLIL
jgi:hypothetical protein